MEATQCPPARARTACVHCGNPSSGGTDFCCRGCETVYHWLQGHALGAYYDLKRTSPAVRRPNPAPDAPAETFAYLDDATFLENYARTDGDRRQLDLYLEGAHCAACVWLTEKVAERVPYVQGIRLNLGNSVATVTLKPQGSFAAVARELQRMGYLPRPVLDREAASHRARENRWLLRRLGVSAACAGNLMLLAISLYGGASGAMAAWFRDISGALYLPILLYGATPLYRSALGALRARQVSIDLPVVFGILLGSGVSYFNLLSGDERIYFDSLAALVFLLLFTRYLLQRTQARALEASSLLQFIAPSRVRKWDATTRVFTEAASEELREGDLIRVLPTEAMPADGVVERGNSAMDCARLTGESAPQGVAPGQIVFAGTHNLDAPIDVRVSQCGANSRLGRLLAATEQLLQQRAPIAVFTDRIARYFVAAVMVLSAGVLLTSIGHGWTIGLNRALAVAIVTCPCTFALITPLCFSLMLGRLARLGILVKGADTLERMAAIRWIVLDKTGTVTHGQPQVTEWDVPEYLSAAILAIESHSSHPLARAIVSHLRSRPISASVVAADVRETPGQGIRGYADQAWIELRRAAQPAGESTEITVLEDGLPVGRITLSDAVRPDAAAAVARLRGLGLGVRLLSGDHARPVAAVASQIGIAPADCTAEASPELKHALIQSLPHALMMGDGVNDAAALAQASVGVAAHGGVEVSLRAADVYLARPGLMALVDVLTIARETLRVVRRNLAFSVIYNGIAGYLALTGRIDPLAAAVLMPLSALTVYFSSIAGTRASRAALRRLA